MLLSLEADRAIVAEKAARIFELEAQIATLRSSIEVLSAAQWSAQERLDSYKYPVLTLPNEIVSEIFQHSLPPYPTPLSLVGASVPTSLTQICRKWREVAHSTPSLWRSIELNGCTGDHQKQVVFMAGIWLERSGSIPLSIQSSHPSTTSLLIPAIIGHTARWEHITLSLNHSHQLLTIVDKPMPLLRTLYLNFHQNAHHPLVLENLPLLRTVMLDDFESPSVSLPWSQLTSLSLRNLHSQECMSILRQTQCLVVCTLLMWTPLKSQSISVHSDSRVDVSLSFLETFVIEQRSDVLAVGEEFISRLVTPTLCRLELPEDFLHWPGSVPTASLKSFLSKSGCMLAELRITKAFVPEDIYRSAFSFVPSIHVLPYS
ncbi:F-box domain-containing protein [Favolaschia claudopus]|uniref:F-box domain-containing protein n=1 Tax=Favolaschia claudopus TaxID=2862362 RepID=A0AAV9ZDT1_9AGAR